MNLLLGRAVGSGPLRSLPWLTLGLTGLLVALFVIAGPAPVAWVFDRDAIMAGEWWRLITGHWVHSDLNHLAWNLAAFGLLGGTVESLGRRYLLGGLATGMAGVDLLLWFGLPGLGVYCGLSGVLNTLLLLALLGHFRLDPRSWAIVLAVGVASLGKILFELLTLQPIFSSTAWASVPEAHLAGWLVGLVLVGIHAVKGRSQHLRPR